MTSKKWDCWSICQQPERQKDPHCSVKWIFRSRLTNDFCIGRDIWPNAFWAGEGIGNIKTSNNPQDGAHVGQQRTDLFMVRFTGKLGVRWMGNPVKESQGFNISVTEKDPRKWGSFPVTGWKTASVDIDNHGKGCSCQNLGNMYRISKMTTSLIRTIWIGAPPWWGNGITGRRAKALSMIEAPENRRQSGLIEYSRMIRMFLERKLSGH